MEVLTEGSLQQLVATLMEQSQSNADHILAEGAKNPDQASLLAALGLLLQNWPNQEVAQSVEIDFGLLPVLSGLKQGQSLILEGVCSEFRLEVKPLVEEPARVEMLQCHFCPLPPPGRCCLKVMSPM